MIGNFHYDISYMLRLVNIVTNDDTNEQGNIYI